MSQTAILSKNMVRMSKRTYNQRLEVITPDMYSVRQLARLNRDLDALYEMLYAQWRTVAEEDYKVLGGVFKILLETVKGLYDACRKAPKEMGLKEETRKLGLNYAALYEVNADIVHFGIQARKDAELQQMLSKAGDLMKNM